MGAHRGDHDDLCGREDLGRAASGRSLRVVHPTTLRKLDAQLGRDPGTVFLWADYTLPVDEARAALEEIVRAAPLWDGRVCNVQVVDATEHAIKLRALVSASDSGRAWDLRVYVRERWLAWLQKNHRASLPQARVVISDREPASPVSGSH